MIEFKISDLKYFQGKSRRFLAKLQQFKGFHDCLVRKNSNLIETSN